MWMTPQEALGQFITQSMNIFLIINNLKSRGWK